MKLTIIDDTTIDGRPRLTWWRLIGILIVSIIGGWIFAFALFGPPVTANLIYYAIMPTLFLLLGLLFGYCPFEIRLNP